MSVKLEDLTLLLENAQKQLAEAQQKLAYAQQVQQYAQYQVNTWTAAVTIEKNNEEQRLKAAALPATSSNALLPASGTVKPTTSPAAQPTPESQDTKDTNKTATVREILRQHPAGLTPSDLWKEVKGQFAHRPYLYSVLKRLKDRDEVTVRRGKYLLKSTPKVEEQKPQSSAVQ